jgi:histidinol-phosphate aminotransferase
MKPLAYRFHPRPRRENLDVPLVEHGALNYGELRVLGLCPEDVLDFSASTNPYGHSPTVRDVLAGVPLDRYPDRECLELRVALAESLGVSPDQVLPGNGASELIWLTALAFIRPNDRVLVLGPTFGEYARAAAIMGARVTTCPARKETGFIPDAVEIAACLASLRPRIVFLCNPNNPTGAFLSLALIGLWARQHPETLFVVDEAYLPFAATPNETFVCARDNILVLRSLTKDFALAGLRLGCAVGAVRLIAALRNVQPPWSVNALAQAAGVAAIRDLAHQRDSLENLARSKQELVAGLTELGLPPVPSACHFFLVHVGDGAAFRLALLRRVVLVRDCASFGLPEYVRIAARRPEENERLLATIREVI